MGPVLSTWKGQCELRTNFTSANCNRKLTSARFFANGYEATLGPIDESEESKLPGDGDGRDTHTASTVGGSVVVSSGMRRLRRRERRVMAVVMERSRAGSGFGPERREQCRLQIRRVKRPSCN
ncbi:hypothetical protein JCGZ_10870 [Jatropha curcas]|uniref:Uncharacterized protein n=1 Tax=Jatropha curcas TaxID=180498 RepID=A0A067KH78_JATCU|nr:hypothetical protein JCGZ_10870 [Jatropha curcas]